MMQPEYLGDYKLVKQMGSGPLGRVYLAEHRFIKKQYILKVLPKELTAERAFMAQFEEDIARIAQIEHPHIVKVHNVSFHEGVYFLVVDCVVDSIGEITNLAQYMSGRKERLKEEELIHVARQLAEVIETVHKRGVIHGALNLSNILIGKGNPGIEVFVGDLGLYKLLSPAAIMAKSFLVMADTLEAYPKEALRTSEERYKPIPMESEKASKLASAFLQGYQFLAPEQKRCERLTHKADLYAFGVILYYLISGVYPEGIFDLPSQVAPEYQYDWDRLLKAVLHRNPDKRPDLIIPLLGHKKMATITVETQQRTFHEELAKEKPKPAEILPKPIQERKDEPVQLEKQELDLPSMEEMEAAITPQGAHATFALQPQEPILVAAGIEEKEAQAQEQLQPQAPISQLDCLQQTPSFPKTEAPPPTPTAFRPVIHREEVIPSPVSTPAPHVSVVVEKRDITEATPKPITPVSDSYSKVLNSMLKRDPVVKEYHPEPQSVSPVEPIPTEMVVIPGGQYMRGANDGNRDEGPAHKVWIESYAIDLHPVTNEQFVRFLEFMGGEKDQNYHDIIRLKESRINRTSGKLSIESGYAKHPVVGVTWYGAVGYAKWVGKRLPLETEWEIAARGGLEGFAFPTGNNIEKTQANFFSSDTIAVMSYAPNGYGIYDLAGNVYEWCQDWYGYNYYETSALEPNQPKGPLQGVYRVLRGGCWKSSKEDMRCSHRHRNNPGTMNGTYGFRCAANVEAV